MSGTKSLYIRPAIASDALALSRICLLTADAGATGEHLHDFGELPGLVYAEPYVHLPTAFGFVLVDPSPPDSDGESVVGYTVASYDTRAFEAAAEQTWYPALRARFSHYAPPADPGTPLRDADARYVERIHSPGRRADACVAFSSAHMHINLLPAYQRQGWGRKLIGHIVQYLREERGLDGVFLGIDPRNDGARKFYTRMGFRHLEVPPEAGEELGLRFEDFDK